MTKKAQIEGAGSNGLYIYEVVPSSPGSGKSLVVSSSFVTGPIAFDLWSCDSALTYQSSQSHAFAFSGDPQTTAALTIPSGGFGLVLVNTGDAGIAPNSGLTEVSEIAGGLGRVGAYEMTATGTPSVNTGGSGGTIMLAAAYGP